MIFLRHRNVAPLFRLAPSQLGASKNPHGESVHESWFPPATATAKAACPTPNPIEAQSWTQETLCLLPAPEMQFWVGSPPTNLHLSVKKPDGATTGYTSSSTRPELDIGQKRVGTTRASPSTSWKISMASSW